ncbi:YqeG family HAD IIIA-type phosphatase [Desulfuribacillus alkaliarsenatis]|uniref:HAD family hydrolase n=1 Tax=Desulfuribacillus alkaliarsenatis TaxID=766136 RepID=A0A1E5G0L2_9FIRM|nr:hypothetical protein BHF68_08850 [Desulfuribacillus alkaliarsenatis]
MKKFIPDLYVTNIHQIKPKDLKKRGIEGVLTDLDNTLVRWDEPATTQEVIQWFKELNDEGIKVVIISNNNEIRVKEFADPMNVSFIHKARKPLKKGFVTGLKMLQLPANKTAVIGDQVLTDVLGGNRMGMYTILVDPIGEKEFLMTKFNRRIEKRIVRHLFKKGLISWTR